MRTGDLESTVSGSGLYVQFKEDFIYHETDSLLCKENGSETAILLLQAVEREEKAWA